MNLKNRYWVYGDDDYYPSPFLDSVKHTTNNLEEAKEYLSFMENGSYNESEKFGFVFSRDVSGIFDSKEMEYVK